MTQPDTHDHPGGAAQPTASELPDNAAELSSAVYNVGDRFMDLEEAKLLVSEDEADDFHQSRSLYVSCDTSHGNLIGGDEMSKDHDEATARIDDGFFDSVMATSTCHGIRGGEDQMTKHQAAASAFDDDGFFDSVMATGSLSKLPKPKNEPIRSGTKRPLQRNLTIGDYEDGTDHKRQAAPRTSTSGPFRWRKDLVARCLKARQQAIIREAETTAMVDQA
jgi:hypothetical protein